MSPIVWFLWFDKKNYTLLPVIASIDVCDQAECNTPSIWKSILPRLVWSSTEPVACAYQIESGGFFYAWQWWRSNNLQRHNFEGNLAWENSIRKWLSFWNDWCAVRSSIMVLAVGRDWCALHRSANTVSKFHSSVICDHRVFTLVKKFLGFPENLDRAIRAW